MFEMICRVFKIAGNSRRKIVAGIVCNILKSFFNGFMMFGVFWILLHLDGLSPAIIGQAFGVILGSVLGRFFFQWMYDRTPGLYDIREPFEAGAGWVWLDATTANVVCQIFDALSPDRQETFKTLPASVILKFCWRVANGI